MTFNNGEIFSSTTPVAYSLNTYHTYHLFIVYSMSFTVCAHLWPSKEVYRFFFFFVYI